MVLGAFHDLCLVQPSIEFAAAQGAEAAILSSSVICSLLPSSRAGANSDVYGGACTEKGSPWREESRA